jgi:hypothetical protein
MNSTEYSTYILLDASLIGGIENPPWIKDRRCRGWVERIYDRRAAAVSPVLIDIQAAQEKGRIAEMMNFVAACNPKFHISFIDTQLSLVELASHLRQLIYFVDEEGDEFTLRFADGAVLRALAKICNPDQWKSVHAPIIRWGIHNNQNKTEILAASISKDSVSFPLLLTRVQVNKLKEAMAVYQLMAKTQTLRKKVNKIHDFAKVYEWTSSAREVWLASGQSDSATLWNFMSGVFDTDGKLLRVPDIQSIISGSDLAKVNKIIRDITSANCYCTAGFGA